MNVEESGGVRALLPVHEGAAGRDTRKADRLRRMWDFLLTNQAAFDRKEFDRYDIVRATSESQLASVLELRELKYGRHAADFEPEDLAPNSELYLTVDPNGKPIATVRFAFDLHGHGLLKAHQLTEIPDVWRLGPNGTPSRLSEGVRLCNAGRTKKEQLFAKLWIWFKVAWRSEDLDVDWTLALARPPINDDYRRQNFHPPGPEPFWVTPHDYPVPHELLAQKIRDPNAPWANPEHWMHWATNDRPKKHQAP